MIVQAERIARAKSLSRSHVDAQRWFADNFAKKASMPSMRREMGRQISVTSSDKGSLLNNTRGPEHADLIFDGKIATPTSAEARAKIAKEE